jgi:hypothetical protein
MDRLWFMSFGLFLLDSVDIPTVIFSWIPIRSPAFMSS